MKLKPIARNQNEMTIQNGNYTITIFFSYETPVAIHIKNNRDRILITDKKYSPTTTRHINLFCSRYQGDTFKIPQDSIENILNFYR